MANNRIQIKRSVANATVTGLSNGELAFTQASNTLHIGLPDGSGVLRIGGAQYPGVLTANHALVANSSSAIDKIIVANAVITTITANGSVGGNGQVLVTNGSAIYWGTGTSGANTQIQFNDSGVANATSGFTFNKVTNTMFIGNTIVFGATSNNQLTSIANSFLEVRGGWDDDNGVLSLIGGNYGTSTYAKIALTGNTKSISLEGDTTTLVTQSGAHTIAVANATGVYFTDTINAHSVTVGSWFIANQSGVYSSGIVNASIVAVGNSFRSNTTQVSLGAGTKLSVNGALGTANQVLRTDSSGVPYWSTDAGDISSITAGVGLTGGGSVDDITVSVLANNGIFANSTGTFAVASNGVFVDASGIGVNANNGIVSNTSGTWAKAANGISVDSSGINVVAGTGVHVNSTAVYIGQEVETTSNVTFANVVTTDLTVNGNTIIGNAITDTVTVSALVSSNVMPSANNTYHIGNNTLRWAQVHAANLHATSGTFDGSVQIAGDVIVSGNLVTTNVQSVIISDPIMYLAGNNYSSDLVDIGIAANYHDISDSSNRHTGLFRDHTDNTWKLFYNLTQELSGNNDVDTSDPSYRIATLQAFLDSGGLQTNTTHVGITANSTVSVAIVANTLTLSTALAGTEGGTGYKTTTNQSLLVGNTSNGYDVLTLGTSGYVLQSNGTAIVYDYLDGGSF